MIRIRKNMWIHGVVGGGREPCAPPRHAQSVVRKAYNPVYPLDMPIGPPLEAYYINLTFIFLYYQLTSIL